MGEVFYTGNLLRQPTGTGPGFGTLELCSASSAFSQRLPLHWAPLAGGRVPLFVPLSHLVLGVSLGCLQIRAAPKAVQDRLMRPNR